MYISSAITNIPDLQSWFEALTKHGYWSIYRGNDKKPAERTASQTYEDPETGWQALLRSISIQTNAGGGLFTIYVANSEKDTSGFTTRYSSAISMNGFQQPGIQGINPDSIGAIVEKEISSRIAAYESKREIDDLYNEIAELKKSKRSKGIAGFLNQFGELLEENQNLANIITPLIHGFAAKFLGMKPSATINGIPDDIIHSAGKDPDLNNEEDIQEYTEDEMNRLANCINELAKHFPDPIGLLEKFVEFVNKNPEGAKLMLSSIIK